MGWFVSLSREAKKQREKLRRNGTRPPIVDAIDFLLFDLEETGPKLTTWPNYSGIVGTKGYHHCHLRKGKPTFVACWRVIDEKTKKIEVFYVGTHEGAPY